MKKFKFLFTAMLATLTLAACGEAKSGEAPVSQPEISQPVSGEGDTSAGIVLPNYDDAYAIAVVCDEHVASFKAYADKDYTTELPAADFYKSRSKTDGTSISKEADSQFYFKVTFAEGWHAGAINTTGTGCGVKTPGDTKIDDAYRITKINENIIVNIVSSNETVGFNVTIEPVQNATVTVYKDQGYTIVDTDEHYQTRNGKSDPYPYCNDGNDSQFCFKIVPANGYDVDRVTVVGLTNPDATDPAPYKNIKDPEETAIENCWRITKVTQDIKITITIVPIPA